MSLQFHDTCNASCIIQRFCFVKNSVRHIQKCCGWKSSVFRVTSIGDVTACLNDVCMGCDRGQNLISISVWIARQTLTTRQPLIYRLVAININLSGTSSVWELRAPRDMACYMIKTMCDITHYGQTFICDLPHSKLISVCREFAPPFLRNLSVEFLSDAMKNNEELL